MGSSAEVEILLALLSYMTTILSKNHPTVWCVFFKQNKWKVQISTSYIYVRIFNFLIEYHCIFKYSVSKLPSKEKKSIKCSLKYIIICLKNNILLQITEFLPNIHFLIFLMLLNYQFL